MAKVTSRFVCQACGAETSKWAGKCESCGEWNSVSEEAMTSAVGGGKGPKGRRITLTGLKGEAEAPPRLETGITELDRVTGGGLVPGSALLVGGDPGIGKSTLVKEILPRAADDRLSWVVCHCGGDGRGPMLELGSGLGIDIKAEEKAAADRRTAGAVGVPGVAGASDGKSYRPQSIGTADSSEMLPHVVERLRSMSKQQPTVLIIEDVHADPYIKPLIGDLLAAVGGHRVLVLATGRPGEIADGLREYARPSIGAGSGVTITVGGLDSREAAEMLGVSGSSDVDALLEATGGNPLYLLTGAVADDGGAGLYDFVRAELAKLAPLSRKLVQLLGVHGGAMSHDELAAASGLGDELSDALHPLLSSGLATERSTRALEIQIRHQTIGEAITDALSGSELIQLHRTIRDTARGSISASPRPNPATLVLAARHAWHATASENVDDKVLAAELCEQAGDAAQDHGEWAQAAELYSRALDCKDATDDERIGRCRLGRAVALFRLGSSDSTDAFIDAAKDASRRADAAMLTDVVLAWDRGIFSQATQVNNERLRLLQRALRNGGLDPDRRARLMAGYASELTFSDRWAERFAIADEALELSETCDVATQAYVLSHRQLTIACLETTDERARSADAFVELANDLRDPHLQFQAKFQRTGPAVLEGDLALLDDLIDEAEDLAQHLSIKLFKWLVHHAKSSLRLLQGDLEQARMLSAEAFALVKGSQHQHEAALVHGEQSCHFSRLGGTLEDLAPMLTKIGGGRENGYTVAALLATAGDLDSAATMLDHDGLGSVDELPRHILERPALQNLAVLADALNRPDLGRDVAVRLQERPRDLGISGVAQPCGHHFAAVALRPSQDWDRLFAHHLAAIAVHDRAHHLLLALEARRELARSMAAAGLVRLDPATLEPAASGGTTSEAGSVIDADELRKRVNTEAESLGLAGLTVS